MTSTMRADNLESRTGGATELVNQSAAKVRGSWDTDGILDGDDLNISSVTDNSIGNYTVNINNNFANANYQPSGNHITTSHTIRPNSNISRAVGSLGVATVDNTGTQLDNAISSAVILITGTVVS